MTDYIIHNVHSSNFANAMIKYLVACNISDRIPKAVLSNYFLPAWDIDIGAIKFDHDRAASFTEDMRLDYMRIEYLINAGVKVIVLHGHLQRVENMPSRQLALSMFPMQPGMGTSFGDEFIVCPIRAAEILEAPHPDYVLLPIDFYKEIFASMPNVRPVFMGQTAPNLYMETLRVTFPEAIFIETKGALSDFHTIRLSKRIVLPVSTFAWLGSWMSEANQIILPVFGLFNPLQAPDNDLIPVGDDRYTFYQFPVQKAVKLESALSAHKQIAGQWRRVSGINLARLNR